MVFKLTNLLIGVAIVTAFVVTFASFYSNISTTYSISYDNSTLQSMDKMNKIKNISEKIEQRHQEDTNNQDLSDVLGNIIADGIDIARLGSNSYSALLELKDVAFEKLNIPNIWGIMAFVTIIVAVFVGIILRIKVGADV